MFLHLRMHFCLVFLQKGLLVRQLTILLLHHQLFLKTDRVGGDDDALVALDDAANGGEQIGERLAHARAGLDDE